MNNSFIGFVCRNCTTNKYVRNTADDTSVFVESLKMREYNLRNISLEGCLWKYYYFQYLLQVGRNKNGQRKTLLEIVPFFTVFFPDYKSPLS